MSKKILVAFASGSGSTGEVAEAIGKVLSQAGVTVDVRPANDVTSVSDYSAVLLGSSIRFGRWLPEAVRFFETHRRAMARLPVAYFTTCLTLLNNTKESRKTVLSYLQPVLQLAPQIEPVGKGLFAGSFDPGRRLIMESEAGPHGDYRDWEAIRRWAEEVCPALLEGKVRAAGRLALGEEILSYTDMTGVDLHGADLHGAELREAKLTGANLRGADLSNSDLTKADLQGADLSDAGLGWAELSRSGLRAANLRAANLMGADLREADLREADLSRATLNGADLTRANLSAANLSFADLNWANLTGADLRQANLGESSLGWANLSDAALSQANLRGARYNEHTAWPKGFSAEEAGCTFVAGLY